MDAAEQVSGGGSRPGDWALPGWRRSGKPLLSSRPLLSIHTYGPRHKAVTCLLVPFIRFKFNDIYCPGISSVDPVYSVSCVCQGRWERAGSG